MIPRYLSNRECEWQIKRCELQGAMTLVRRTRRLFRSAITSAIVCSTFAGCAGIHKSADRFFENRKATEETIAGKTLFIAPLHAGTFHMKVTSTMIDSGKEAFLAHEDTLLWLFNHELGTKYFREAKSIKVLGNRPADSLYGRVIAPERLLETTHRLSRGSAETYFQHPRKEDLDSLGIEADMILFISSLSVSFEDVVLQESSHADPMKVNSATPRLRFIKQPHVPIRGIPGPAAGVGMAGPLLLGLIPQPDPLMKKPVLKGYVKYILWDYTREEPLACGIFDFFLALDMDAFREEWEKMVRGICRRIMEHSGPVDWSFKERYYAPDPRRNHR